MNLAQLTVLAARELQLTSCAASKDLRQQSGRRGSEHVEHLTMDQGQILQMMLQYCKENMLFESMKAIEDETSVHLPRSAELTHLSNAGKSSFTTGT
jgi:hypothetical protein